MMDDDIKAWLAKFRAEISLQIDKVLDRQSLTLAEVKSLEARIGGLEEGINGIGLLLKYQGELLAKLAGEP
jgi:hypothetical protein